MGFGAEILGFTITGAGPIGTVNIPWKPGLTVLYGANGAGKTWILRGIEAALTGVRLSPGNIDSREQTMVHLKLTEPDAPLSKAMEDDGIGEAIFRAFYRDARQLESTVREGFDASEWEEIWSGLSMFLHRLPEFLTVRRALISLLGDRLNGSEKDVVDFGLITLMAQGNESPSWSIHASARYNDFAEDFEIMDELVAVNLEFAEHLPWGEEEEELGADEIHRRLVDGLRGAGITWSSPLVDHVLSSIASEFEQHGGGPDDPDFFWDFAYHADPGISDEILSGEYLNDGGHFDFRRRQQRAQTYPEWVPIPLAHIDYSSDLALMPVVTGRTSDSNRATFASLSKSSIAQFNEEVEPQVSALSEAATQLAHLLMPSLSMLYLQIGDMDEWLMGSPVRWRAVDPDTGLHGPIENLSEAQQRWARIAIDLAIRSELESENPGIVLIDEPELGLHRTAATSVAQALAEIGALEQIPIVVASHSSPFLRRRDATVFHVRRQVPGSGFTEVRDVDPARERIEDVARELDLDPSEILQLISPFLVVEGEHDKTVLEWWISDQVRHRNPRVVAMRGAANVFSILDSELIFDFTTAKVVVILDNISNTSGFAEVWGRARLFASEDNMVAAVDQLRELRGNLGKSITYEQETILNFALEALRSGHYPRLEIFGFTKGDIIEFFAPSLFGLDKDWETLTKSFNRLRDSGKTSMSFKQWLRSAHKAKIDSDTLALAYSAGGAEELHRELGKLKELL